MSPRDLTVDPMRVGAVAEYADPESLLEAVARLRGRGYQRLDAYTPYEVQGLDEALELPRPRIALFGLLGGVTGACFGYFVQWYCNTWDYPLDVGGRPLHPVLAYVPITFESAILFASLSVFLGLLLAGRLPEVWNPLFELEGFDRVSVDRFWIGIDERDERFDPAATPEHLALSGAVRVVRITREERR